MLEVLRAGRAFGGEALFDDVSLTVPAGAAVALVGPNGCGKSTFLRGVLGTDPFDEGTVLLDGDELDERDPADRVLHELRLRPAADRMPATLSSGQRRRLSLAACLVRPRRLLVLDEPEQRLDADGRAWLAGWLRAERASGVAVLFASHDAGLVDGVADRAVRIGR